jgi:ubiquitin-conjugating enzyme E2 variant
MKKGITILLTASAVSGFSHSRSFQIRNSVALSAALGSSEPSSSALNAATLTEDATSSSQDVEVAPKKKSYLEDGFVFGLEESGLERPKGKAAQVVVEGDTLETQGWQVAMVAGTFLGHAGFAANAFSGMLQVNGGDVLPTTIQAIALLLSSWIIADLGSGVLHFSVDNYGNGRTPIMGGLIAAFQGHHSAPWTITERGFCNNVYKLCIPFGVAPMAVISLITGPYVTFFFTFFCVMEIMSQEFHKWSHMTKGECPDWVNWLQSADLTIDRKRHAQHHIAPYDGNYCIISGINNQWLDQSGIFRRLEHVIYEWNGVESNAWKLDAALKERTLNGEYKLQ